MRNFGAAALWTALAAGGTILAIGSLATGLGASAGPQTAQRPEPIPNVASGPIEQSVPDAPYDSELLEHVLERTTGQISIGAPSSSPNAKSIDAVLEEAEEFDEAELEQLRGQFRSLAESMHALDPNLPIDVESIELAEYEELSYARAAFLDYTTFSEGVDALALIIEDPTIGDAAYALLEEDPWKYNGRIQDAVFEAAAAAPLAFPTSPPNFTPLIPSPEPATPQPVGDEDTQAGVDMSPTPGIDADWPSNEDEGLWPPNYPDYIPACVNLGVTDTRSDETVALVLRILNAALSTTEGILSSICKLEVEALGNSENASRCIAWWLVATLRVLPAFFQEMLDRCDAAIDGAEIQAGFQNSQRILARLKSHEASMRRAMYASDLFLRDMQVFQERLWIEENLASAEDDPDVLLMLPSSTCRALPGDPTQLYPPDGPIRQRCGKIEEVKRIVEQTISMVEESGEGINNAEAEYDAAIAHLTAGRYRDAFLRFRKAYREAVSTRGPR